MRFVVEGYLFGVKVQVAWEDGIISSGNPHLDNYITWLAESHYDGQYFGYQYAVGTTHHLKHPHQIMAILNTELGSMKVVESTIPPVQGDVILDEDAILAD